MDSNCASPWGKAEKIISTSLKSALLISDISGNFFLILFFKNELIDFPMDPLEHKYLRFINL